MKGLPKFCPVLTFCLVVSSWKIGASQSLNDADIADKLRRLTFKNSGTVLSTDQFVWHNQPALYLEPENVTTLRKGWQVWKNFNYLYKRLDNGSLVAPPVGMRSAVPLGGISTGFVELRADGSFHEWTIMNQTPGGAAKIQIFDDAFLAVSWQITNRATSATRSQNLKFKPQAREAEIITLKDFMQKRRHWDSNRSKRAGPLHFGTLALRTHPSENMKTAKIEGVQSLEYSGAHPVSRLRVHDDRLPFNLTVFGFSAYSVNDVAFSATPAVHFVPYVENPSKSDFDVWIHLVVPRGIEPRTQRSVKAMPYEDEKVYTFDNVASDLDCFNLCNLQEPLKCKSWSRDILGHCLLYNTINLNFYNDKMSSGLRSSWVGDERGDVQCLSYATPGDAPPSGNMSLCTPTNAGAKMSVFSDLSEWKPSIEKEKQSENGKQQVGVYGALSTPNMEIHKGKADVLAPIVLTWFYPTKDFLGQMYGNMYTQMFDDSLDAANFSLSATGRVLDDILALNTAFYNSSLPEFLQDMLLNSISHVRSAMWFNDKRWRQWEAYDCTNIESVHNDGERHIPYIMLLPEAVKNKVTSWARSQLPNGMIPEQLHEGCSAPGPGPLDHPGGRVMSDVSSMFIVYVLELYKWGNEVDFAKSMWPYAKKAAKWHLDQSFSSGSLEKMVTTYDVQGLSAYTYSTYSTSFHLLAMRAAQEFAKIMGDEAFANECGNAYSRAQGVLDVVQWNATSEYYNAYTQVGKADKVYREYNRKLGRVVEIDPNTSPTGALMTDSFYSQVLAYSVGLGLLPQDADKLKSHLKAEYRINNTPYGMLVLTGRHPYPGPPSDNAVWQMGNPNWATLNIHLGEDVNNALQVAAVTLEAWRSKVNDIWNVAGISGGVGYGAEGQPYITSHYGYFMSSWHLIMALTGQQANLPEKTLTFDPKVQPPYQYPILLSGTVGILNVTNGGYSVCLVIGRPISLTTISVSGSVCPQVPKTMGPGDCVHWAH